MVERHNRKGFEGDLILLTPGPITTAAAVKISMMHDYGSRDHHVVAMSQSIRSRLVTAVFGEGEFVCVPLQGSGTFAIEAAVGTLVPSDGGLVVLANGAYGRRIAAIGSRIGRRVRVLSDREDEPNNVEALDRILRSDSNLSHVAVVHCETTTGILNPVEAVAAVAERYGRRLIIDAMSSFGALQVDARAMRFDAVVSSSNKCLEGVPGIAFCVIRREALETAPSAPSLVLDLKDQWLTFERTGEWRFTPPVQVIAAFNTALELWEAEGGQPGRLGRYEANLNALIAGMKRLGFVPYLKREHQAPIIVTFHKPAQSFFSLERFFKQVRRNGYLLYPGKVTNAETFRIGCIGAITEREINGAVEAIEQALAILSEPSETEPRE